MKIFTSIHVLISLAGILSGLCVLFGLLTAKRLEGWTKLFLTTSVGTSATGFLFPFHGLTPAIVAGILSLLVSAAAIFARYGRQLAGAWRATYVISAVFALYLNVFVLVAQSFLHVPALKAIAPTQNDPPFKLTQLVVLVAFIALAMAGVLRFRKEAMPKLNKPNNKERKSS